MNADPGQGGRQRTDIVQQAKTTTYRVVQLSAHIILLGTHIPLCKMCVSGEQCPRRGVHGVVGLGWEESEERSTQWPKARPHTRRARLNAVSITPYQGSFGRPVRTRPLQRARDSDFCAHEHDACD